MPFTQCYSLQILHQYFSFPYRPNATSNKTGLLLRDGGRGFPLATMNVAPGFFYSKTEQKKNQKKSLAVSFQFEIILVAVPQ